MDVTTFTCDAAGCKSYSKLHPADAADKELARRALIAHGWAITPGSRPKHYCFAHAHLATPGVTDDAPVPDEERDATG